MSKWELVVWLYAIKSVKAGTGGRPLEELKREHSPFSAYSVIDLNRLASYVSIFKGDLKPKDIRDYSDYFRKILRGLIQKTVFEIEYEKYKEFLDGLGYGYWLKFLPKRIDKSRPITTAVIESVYKLENNELQINFVNLIAPLIVEYKRWYSTYRLEELLKLSSRYSLILYRIFREKLGLKNRTFRIGIEELKTLLNVNLRNFQVNSRILKPSLKEINENTTLRVHHKPIRQYRGGKIVGFEFEVSEREREMENTPERLPENPKVLREWLEETLNNLSRDLGIGVERLKEELGGLGRVSPSVALWFLLHYPQDTRAVAWEHIKLIDRNISLKYPDKYIQKLILSPKEELRFLLDQRTKDGVRGYLSPHSVENELEQFLNSLLDS